MERKNSLLVESFIDDEEKMIDFIALSKEEFLKSYSYINEESYNLTVKELIKQHFTMKELDYIASACSNYIEDLEIKQKQVNEELEKVKNEMWRIYEKVKAIREAGGSDVSV